MTCSTQGLDGAQWSLLHLSATSSCWRVVRITAVLVLASSAFRRIWMVMSSHLMAYAAAQVF